MVFYVIFSFMSKLVGRHALSEANNHHNFGKPAFGHADAPLMYKGRAMAQAMGGEFIVVHGIIPAITPIAVSKMRRSQETAELAGFVDLRQYESLNEVEAQMSYTDLREAIDNRRYIPLALEAAELLLEDPPEEPAIVAHGLLIAHVCEVLGVAHEFENFIPKFCEIRELPI